MPITLVEGQSTVRAARDRYLADNGFTMDGYTDARPRS